MAVLLQHGPSGDPPGVAHDRGRDRFTSIIVVLPTKRRIRHLTREVVRNAGAVSALPFYTLDSLARSVYGAIAESPHVVAGPVQTLLYDAAVGDVAPALRYFKLRGGRRQLFRGTFEKIVAVLTNLKESGVSHTLLCDEASSAPQEEQAKLIDMAAIFEAYEHRLALLRAEDAPGVYRFLADQCPAPKFNEAFRSLYPGVTSVSLAGFDEFTQPEIGFITRVCSVPGLSVSLLFDFLPDNVGLFGHLRENYEMFRGLGFTPHGSLPEREDVAFGLSPASHPEHVRSAVRHIAASLFNTSLLPRPADLSTHVTVMRAKTRVNEIVLICKLIKRLLSDHPARDPASICVAMVRPQPYTEIVREVFPAYGIPVNVTDRFELSRSPVIASLIAILQVPLNGFRREDLLRATRTPYCTIPAGTGTVSGSNLDLVSRQLRIVAGYRAWSAKIGRRLEQIAQLRAASTDRGAAAGLDEERRSLVKADEDIRAIGALVGDIARDQTPEEFRRTLSAVMDRLDVTKHLVAGSALAGEDLVEKDVRAYAAFREVIEDMTRLLQFQDGRSIVHPLRFYYEHLRTAISGERYNVREQVGRGVLVTSIEETRGLPVDVMIVAGLVDGEFPSVYQPEVFLSTRRQSLREQRHIWQNRYLFYQAITNWSEHLYLTYPEREGDLDLVRSPFVDALVSVAAVQEYRATADVPWSTDLSSEEEFLVQEAKAVRDRVAGDDAVPEPLREAREEVLTAVGVERGRLETHALPHYEGYIFDAIRETSRERLTSMRSRVYSASQLEAYGQCPFKFFAGRLLRLPPEERFDEDITPLERGSIVHEALFEFFLHRRETGRPSLGGCSDHEFATALEDLLRIMAGKLDAVEIPDPFWTLERELLMGSADSPGGLVRRFLEAERERVLDATPSYFEVSFGLAGARRGASDPLLSRETPIRIGDVLLGGKIDRIEIGDGFFTIIDYKTGSTVPTIRDIRSGMSVQLPLYLVAVEQLLVAAGTPGKAPAAGLYYKVGEKVALVLGMGSKEFLHRAFDVGSRSQQLLASTGDLRTELQASVTRIAGYVDGIANGRFPLTTPDRIEKICGYCDYRTVCRIQNFRHVQPASREDA